VQASLAFFFPSGILVFPLSIAGIGCSCSTRASPKVLTSPVFGTQFSARIVAVMAGPEGFACGSRVVVAVSFGPKVYKFFLPVLAGFYHALLARPCARARLIAGHAGFSEGHNKSLLTVFRDTRYPLDFSRPELDTKLLF